MSQYHNILKVRYNIQTLILKPLYYNKKKKEFQEINISKLIISIKKNINNI